MQALLKTKAGQRRKRLDKYHLCLFLLASRCGLSDVNTIKGKQKWEQNKVVCQHDFYDRFSCCSAMILIQLLAAVKEMRCQKRKRCKPEQKIITSGNVLQIIPLKIQLHCSSSLLIPQIFLFSNHWIETHFNGMKLYTWWQKKCLSSYARPDIIIFRRFANLIFLKNLHQTGFLEREGEEEGREKSVWFGREKCLFWLFSLCSKINWHLSIFWTCFFYRPWSVANWYLGIV